MNILGVLIWFLLPVLLGYSTCKILRWKEMNQIETYLIGFFLLFLLQGIILVPLVILKQSFQTAKFLFLIIGGVITLFFFISILFELKKRKVGGEEKRNTVLLRKEKVYLCLAIIVFGLMMFRMYGLSNMLREDIMLETVKVTVDTETMFQYHPLTGRQMEGGMILSKKIISLPLFYSCFVSLTDINPQFFLNEVVGIFVYVASLLSCTLIYKRIANINRKKLYLFFVLYGLLVLSGDYHQATLAYQILYQGYLGETICYAVILPYQLYIIISWYQEEGSEEKLTFKDRSQFVLKLLLPLSTSFFIAGLGTGCVLLILCLFISAACCLIQSIMEVRACRES